MNVLLRSVSLIAFATCALAARAVDAYSNLAPAPNVYTGNMGYIIGPGDVVSFRFVATATGALASFSGAVNNNTVANPGPIPYALSVYADGPSQTRGGLLATSTGVSTGIYNTDTNSALSSVSFGVAPR